MVLWQLCFDKQIAAEVLNDRELYSFISELNKKSAITPGEDKDEGAALRKNASGLIWLLNKANEPPRPLTPAVPKSDAETQNLNREVAPKSLNLKDNDINQKFIMISYNRDSRDLCLRIKAELEKEGIMIWIDVEDISGSSLESMANAIEKSVRLRN